MSNRPDSKPLIGRRTPGLEIETVVEMFYGSGLSRNRRARVFCIRSGAALVMLPMGWKITWRRSDVTHMTGSKRAPITAALVHSAVRQAS
jgi:hypothetical protein